jgi:hypothetical protein
MTKRRWIDLALVVLLFLVVVFGAVAVWHRGTYHEWPGQSFPDRLSYCRRDYLGPGTRVPARKAPPLTYAYEVSPLLATHRKVFAEATSFNNDKGEPCPMVLWVRDGSEYVEYGLSGGP